MIKGRQLDHVSLHVPNLEEAIKFYQDKLGFAIKARFKSSYGMEFVYIESNGMTYELNENRNLQVGKVDHIAYVSENIEEDYKYFKEQGYTMATDGVGYLDFLWDNGVYFFMIISPTGEVIEFCEKK